MDEQIGKVDQEIEDQLSCPECGKGFQDMRGLTSHARHRHELSKEDLNQLVTNDKKRQNKTWKVFGGLGALLLAILTIRR